MSEENQTEQESGASIKLRLPASFKEEVEAAAGSLQISVSALTRLALVSYMKAIPAPASRILQDDPDADLRHRNPVVVPDLPPDGKEAA